MANSLAVVASNFRPPQNPLLRYEIEVCYRLSIPDNVKHWQVFEDEEDIQCFMETIEEFSNLVIDASDEEIEDLPQNRWLDTVAGHKVLQLEGNVIPRILVPLERLFEKLMSRSVLTRWWKKDRWMI